MKIVAMIVLMVGLLALVPGSAEPQADLSKILVGKWQGEYVPLVGGAQPRVLVFEAVRPRGDGWGATAKFGPSEESLHPVSVTIEVAGAEVRVRFKARGRFETDLTLRGDNRLAGTVKVPTGQGWREASMTLSKVK